MEQDEPRAPVLRADLDFRTLSGGNVFVSHPEIAAQVLDERAVAALRLCRGQNIREMLPQVREVMEYACAAEEWIGFLRSLQDTGMFEGRPKRHPRVRLFDPEPALDFLTRRCRFLFTAPAVVAFFLLLFVGLFQLLSHWGLFVAEVGRITGRFPLPCLLLYYLCFAPVGLIHELGHGAVCRWFGGEVLEVGVRKNNANMYVLSNTVALSRPQQLIPYYAAGAFCDMVVFFLLVNLWLRWPNFWTLIFLLPQALFVLLFSYAVEDASDTSRIVAQWSGIRDAGGRLAFLKQCLKARPRSAVEWKRAIVYFFSIALQGLVVVFLIWSFREPVRVAVWPGLSFPVPFWPPILYGIYRLVRKVLFDFRSLLKWFSPRPAASAA
jgi:hypothetical protein